MKSRSDSAKTTAKYAIALHIGVRVSMPISVPTDVQIVRAQCWRRAHCRSGGSRYWLSRQRWNRATLLTITAYGFRAIISA
jgi:hypothetical protein